MSKSTSQKVKVGIFVVVGTILLIGTLYGIGSREHLFSKNIILHAVFDDVSGLVIGNNVRYSGIDIGTVTHIEMKEIGKITVQMSVSEKASSFMKKDAIASINSDGLVGSMVVNIVPGKNEQTPVVVSGDTILSLKKTGTDEMLKTLNKTNENAALLTADLLLITNRILEGKGTLGALVNDTLMAQDIQLTMAELRKASEETGLVISKVNRIISKINYDESAAALILSDTAAANQIRNVFTNIEKSSEDISVITKNLDDYLKEIKSGKGALNHITQDEGFVRDIDSTMNVIKEAADKLNESMDALQHNFLFRGYFKKQERQEKKK